MPPSAPGPERLLHRLDWTVLRRLDGLLQGDYRTLFHGCGLELSELCEYQFGDDIRRIDWNVTARMQTPYVRRYIEERDLTAWFLLDLSPSVDFGTVRTVKRRQLIEFSALLARLLTRRGNRVAAVLFSGKVEGVIPPGSGQAQVLRLVNDIGAVPELRQSPPTDLAALLKTALGVIRRRSLVFIVSDFISVDGWGRTLDQLTRRHEVLAVRLRDPREVELPDVGPVIMEDAETGEQLYVDTHDAGFRRRFAEAGQRREYALNVAFRRAGVDVVELSTDDDVAEAVARFAMLRRRRRQSPASSREPVIHGLSPRPVGARAPGG